MNAYMQDFKTISKELLEIFNHEHKGIFISIDNINIYTVCIHTYIYTIYIHNIYKHTYAHTYVRMYVGHRELSKISVYNYVQH